MIFETLLFAFYHGYHDDQSWCKNNEDMDGLMIACLNGHLPVVNLLLRLKGERAVNANQRSNLGNTAFILACQDGHLKVVQRLLELKGDRAINVNEKDKWGKTGLDIAIEKGHTEVAETIRAFVKQQHNQGEIEVIEA